MDGFSRKRILLITLSIVVVLVVIIVTIVVLNNNKKSNEPTKTKVETGETISAEEIKRRKQNQNNNSNSEPGTTNSNQNSGGATKAAPTQDNFYDLIVQSNSVAPDSSGQVSFGILNTQNPMAGWYIVTIRSGNLEPAKVVFHQTNDPNNPLTIVAGPGTYFPDSIPLPSAVRQAL